MPTILRSSPGSIHGRYRQECRRHGFRSKRCTTDRESPRRGIMMLVNENIFGEPAVPSPYLSEMGLGVTGVISLNEAGG